MRYWMNNFADMESLSREIFNHFFPTLQGRDVGEASPAGGYPVVNLYEDDEALRVEALLPGVDRESLDVSVLGGQLTISGERKSPWEGRDVKANHRRERWYGRFHRVLELPAEVDADKVKATLQAGVLAIELPKAASAKPQRVKVAMN